MKKPRFIGAFLYDLQDTLRLKNILFSKKSHNGCANLN